MVMARGMGITPTRDGERDLHVRVDTPTYNVLKRRAAKDRRSMSWIVREIVEESLRQKRPGREA